jgi:hypothetical protein
VGSPWCCANTSHSSSFFKSQSDMRSNLISEPPYCTAFNCRPNLLGNAGVTGTPDGGNQRIF